ncbi:MAG: cell division protein FtsQ [Flavobacteriaceae bacterium]|nr:cell division protein FtsQ [Flavobacteriaceae bacterium]
MKNKYRILKILVTVIILGFLLNFSLKRFNNANIKQIAVNISQTDAENKVYFIDEKNVKDFVRKINPSNKIGDIDISKLEKEVNSFPSVDSANVYLKLNGELVLEIIQRVPAFRLDKNGKSFYVDETGEEFPLSKNYSHLCMLVSGNVERSEYLDLIKLVKKIEEDEFNRNFFVGITKREKSYFLMTSDGNYKVEFGTLENMDFKIKGFKAFVEKYLTYQDPRKYSKISLKYNNQIVATLRKGAEITRTQE